MLAIAIALAAFAGSWVGSPGSAAVALVLAVALAWLAWWLTRGLPPWLRVPLAFILLFVPLLIFPASYLVRRRIEDRRARQAGWVA